MRVLISGIFALAAVLLVNTAFAIDAHIYKFGYQKNGYWYYVSYGGSLCKEEEPNCVGSYDCDIYNLDVTLEDIDGIKLYVRTYEDDPLGNPREAYYYDHDIDRDGGGGWVDDWETDCDEDQDELDCMVIVDGGTYYDYVLRETGDINNWDYDASDYIFRYYWEDAEYVELRTGSCSTSPPG